MARRAEVTVVPRRIGGSLAIFIPAGVAKRGRIREGVPVRVSIGPKAGSRVLGALRHRGRHRPFDRHEEGFWPDR